MLIQFKAMLAQYWDSVHCSQGRSLAAPGAVVVLLAQSCLTLCNPVDYSQPSSSVHGILQARILKWVARGSSWHRNQIWVSCISGRLLTMRASNQMLKSAIFYLFRKHEHALWISSSYQKQVLMCVLHKSYVIKANFQN